MKNLFKKITPFYLLFAGFVVYGVAAWFSRGYHHPDEHFQLLEFAGHKLGFVPQETLAWEFPARIRPSLQPWIAVGVIQTCKALGIHEAFDWAFVLRLLSGALTFWVFFLFSGVSSQAFQNPRAGRLLLLAAAAFCWFMPYVGVRFSSENWSAMTLLAGLYFLLKTGEKQEQQLSAIGIPLLAGFLFGLSFWFRFQSAFALAGVAAWVLILERQRFSKSSILTALGGGIVALSLGLVLDRAFYGEWVFTPLNYYRVNIVESKAATFGVEPWWYFVPESLKAMDYAIGIPLFALFLLGTHRLRRNALVWAVIPFVLGHSVVGHKELRFMFPLVFPFLFLAAVGWERCKTFLKTIPVLDILWNLAWSGLLLYNTYLLYKVSTGPALQSYAQYRFIAESARKGPVRLYSEPPGPYPPAEAGKLMPFFYRNPDVQIKLFYAYTDFLNKTEYPLTKGDLILTSNPDALLKQLTGVRLSKVFTHVFPKRTAGQKTVAWYFFRVETD